MLLLLACAHTPAPEVAPAAMPVLPAPRAEVYTRVPARPGDPLVAMQMGDRPWDEALAGAATAVALAQIAGRPMDACEARWKAILAGYPHEVTSWRWQTVPRGEVGQEVVEAALDAPQGADVGVVRARGADDRWVLLVGQPKGQLPPIPRELQVGDGMALGAGARAADPDGKVHAGADTLVLDLEGEWLVQAGGTVFPVYAGEATPDAPPVPCSARAGTPDVRLQGALDAVRDHYGYTRLQRDELLDSVARAVARSGGDGQAALRTAGFIDVPVAAGACEAESVERCLSELWWGVDTHALLVGDVAEYGVAWEPSSRGVRLVMVAAG